MLECLRIVWITEVSGQDSHNDTRKIDRRTMKVNRRSTLVTTRIVAIAAVSTLDRRGASGTQTGALADRADQSRVYNRTVMGVVQVELDQDLVDLLEELHRPVKQAARELIVLELYRQGEISS